MNDCWVGYAPKIRPLTVVSISSAVPVITLIVTARAGLSQRTTIGLLDVHVASAVTSPTSANNSTIALSPALNLSTDTKQYRAKNRSSLYRLIRRGAACKNVFLSTNDSEESAGFMINLLLGTTEGGFGGLTSPTAVNFLFSGSYLTLFFL